MELEVLGCSFVKECGGCPYSTQTYMEQQNTKLSLTQKTFPQVLPKFHFLGTKGIRTIVKFLPVSFFYRILVKANYRFSFLLSIS